MKYKCMQSIKYFQSNKDAWNLKQKFPGEKEMKTKTITKEEATKRLYELVEDMGYKFDDEDYVPMIVMYSCEDESTNQIL